MPHRLSSPCPGRTLSGRAVLAACAVVALSGGPAAQAADGGPTFRFSGFGTVGAVHSSEKNADFTSGSELPNGAGHTHRWDMNQETQIGGQLDARFNDRFTASMQAIMRYRADAGYNPELMMAFARWQALPEVSLRAGRLPIPVFLISDYRNVRYSQPTLRPPVDVYRTFPMYHYDGGDVTWTTTVGAAAISTNAYAGRLKIDLPGQGTLESSRLGGARITVNWGEWTGFGSMMRGGRSTVAMPAASGALDAVRSGIPGVPADPALADQYDVKGKVLVYNSIGLNYDPGEWFLTSEVTQSDTAGYLPKYVSAYAILGLRAGKFTPYLLASRTRTKAAGSDTGNPIMEQVRLGASQVEQKTLAVGMRWDAIKNVALKTEYSRSEMPQGSRGVLTNLQSGYAPGGGYSLWSASVDFVF